MLTDDLVLKVDSAVRRARAEGLLATAEALERVLRIHVHWASDNYRSRQDWADGCSASTDLTNGDRFQPPIEGH